jgi:hypothetical protein
LIENDFNFCDPHPCVLKRLDHCWFGALALSSLALNIGQPYPQPQLQPQLELEAKEAIKSMEMLLFFAFLSPTINLPLLGNLRR